MPRLGRSAGDSRIVVRRVAGQSYWLLMIAIRHRSRDSLSALSGRPTSTVADLARRDVRLDVDRGGRRRRGATRCAWWRTASDQPPTWSTSEARVVAGARRPGRRAPRGPDVVLLGPPPGQPVQPVQPWPWSTASCGDPHASCVRVLTSQATSTSPSRSTRSSSPSSHRQLRSSRTIPRSIRSAARPASRRRHPAPVGWPRSSSCVDLLRRRITATADEISAQAPALWRGPASRRVWTTRGYLTSRTGSPMIVASHVVTSCTDPPPKPICTRYQQPPNELKLQV